MSKSDVFHLGLTKNDLQGATLAIVPGDPDRVEKIAALMDKPVKLASHREFTTWRAELDGKPVIVCSTGIGGPSTSIAVEELAQLGIRTFLRIGTTGAIQPHINVGDVLVTTASVRLDGASLHFAPLEFPAVADFECTTALVEAAKADLRCAEQDHHLRGIFCIAHAGTRHRREGEPRPVELLPARSDKVHHRQETEQEAGKGAGADRPLPEHPAHTDNQAQQRTEAG